MNVLAIQMREEIDRLISTGLPIRRIERMLGVHRDTIMRQKHGRTYADQRSDGVCRYMPQPKRLALWGKEIPNGQRLGWTCAVAYCGNPEHFLVVQTSNSGWRRYDKERAIVKALKDGEYADFPGEPNDEKGVVKFRSALLAPLGWEHFLCRTLPTGGIRIVRAGEYYQDRSEFRAQHRVLMEKMSVWLICAYCKEHFLVPASQHETREFCSKACLDAIRGPRALRNGRANGGQFPGGFFLGFLWDSGDSTVKNLRKPCSTKGCAFPRLANSNTCRHHSHFYEPSMQSAYCGLKLDLRDLIPSEENPHPAYTTGHLWEDQYNYLRVRVLRNGTYDTSERKSDEWWSANVEKAMGIIRSATGKEPPRPGTINTVPTGPQMSLHGKMRNHSKKKIRKVQRNRPAGWHGSHPDQKPVKKWNREIVEEVPMMSPKRTPRRIPVVRDVNKDTETVEMEEREVLASGIAVVFGDDDMESFDAPDVFSWESIA